MSKLKNPAGIGFLLMLSGPAFLLLANLIHSMVGDFSELVANIIMWIALIPPAIGGLACFGRLFSWKNIDSLERALSIVTTIICNPFFYFIYFVICGISKSTLAGLSWM